MKKILVGKLFVSSGKEIYLYVLAFQFHAFELKIGCCFTDQDFWKFLKHQKRKLQFLVRSILVLRKSFSCLRAIAKAGFLYSRQAGFVMASLMQHRLPPLGEPASVTKQPGLPGTEVFPRMRVFQG